MNTQPPTFAKLIRENSLIGHVFEHTATPAPPAAGEVTVCEAMTLEMVAVAEGRLNGIKLVGLKSANGYEYLLEALRTAIPLYEGQQVYEDHPERPGQNRRYRERIGSVENVRVVENQGLYGDLVYNAEHPLAKQLKYDAEHGAKGVGFKPELLDKLEALITGTRATGVDTADGDKSGQEILEGVAGN